MTSRKLSESEKQQILELYRLPSETTSTLAGRFGVSNSTISRVLKSSLPTDEYERLIQQKRMVRLAGEECLTPDLPSSLAVPQVEEQLGLKLEEVFPPTTELQDDSPKRRLRRRTSSADSPAEGAAVLETATTAPGLLPELSSPPIVVERVKPVLPPPRPKVAAPEAEVLEELMDDHRLARVEEHALNDEDDLDEEEFGDDDLDEEEFGDDDSDEEGDSPGPLLLGRRMNGEMLVQILPLAQATIPRTCYLVVDRAAELITRPLKDFGELGQIPEEETQAKTLPVFDNHRVAKRYSNPRNHRVIKLPDGRVLQKTTNHLQAKGITRLLIDGRVYAVPG